MIELGGLWHLSIFFLHVLLCQMFHVRELTEIEVRLPKLLTLGNVAVSTDQELFKLDQIKWCYRHVFWLASG